MKIFIIVIGILLVFIMSAIYIFYRHQHMLNARLHAYKEQQGKVDFKSKKLYSLETSIAFILLIVIIGTLSGVLVSDKIEYNHLEKEKLNNVLDFNVDVSENIYRFNFNDLYNNINNASNADADQDILVKTSIPYNINDLENFTETIALKTDVSGNIENIKFGKIYIPREKYYVLYEIEYLNEQLAFTNGLIVDNIDNINDLASFKVYCEAFNYLIPELRTTDLFDNTLQFCFLKNNKAQLTKDYEGKNPSLMSYIQYNGVKTTELQTIYSYNKKGTKTLVNELQINAYEIIPLVVQKHYEQIDSNNILGNIYNYFYKG